MARLLQKFRTSIMNGKCARICGLLSPKQEEVESFKNERNISLSRAGSINGMIRNKQGVLGNKTISNKTIRRATNFAQPTSRQRR